jgi:glycosyltransferase involved in cell wall biosynthesis
VDILLVFHRPSSFIETDARLLRDRWDVQEWRQSHPFARPLAVLAAVRRSRLVFGWFASWHMLLPITFAWLLGKPSVVVVGGFDLASLPDIRYGNQRGGARRAVTGWVLARATRLLAISRFSSGELEAHAPRRAERAIVVHLGVPDRYRSLAAGERERLVVTVGVVDERNLERKGHRLFVEAARELPDVRFVLVGRWDDVTAVEALRAAATPNVELAGWLPDEELRALLARASVYAQPSRHEGFGLAVAEAMLAGCVPVVTRAGALPEVVGDAGIVVDERTATAFAAGVRKALASGDEAREHARDRVLTEFPLERRRRGLSSVVDELLGDETAGVADDLGTSRARPTRPGASGAPRDRGGPPRGRA